MAAVPVLPVVGLVALVVCSAFFSASEIAVFSLEPYRIDAMVEAEAPGARRLARLREDPHRLLVTILVGNNVVNVAIATVTGALFARFFAASEALVVSTLVASTVVLLFGEIVPKSYGVANAESFSRRVAIPIEWIGRLLGPVVTVFDMANEAIRRLIGGGRDIERPYVTREAIAAMVVSAEETGVIDADTSEIIARAFRFDATPVRQVMVPRVDIPIVSTQATVGDAVDACTDAGTEWVVVHDGVGIDDAVGHAALGSLAGEDPDLPVVEVVEPVLHVFESRELDEVLAELREERVELALVFDQFGAVEGAVDATDIVEELVGDVFDVSEPRSVVQIADGRVRARGVSPVAAVNDAMGVDLPVVESGTVAALLVDVLGRVPTEGEQVEVGDVRFVVQVVEDNRVRRVVVERVEE